MGGVRHPHGETVLVHPYVEDGGTDPYGNPVTGFGEDIVRPYCAVSPRVEEEDVGGHNRTMVIRGFDVYDTFDAPVGPYDELTVRGVRCVVDGEIARWANPFTGSQPGCLIRVKRVEG